MSPFGVLENCINGVKTGQFSVSTKPVRIPVLRPLELQVAKTSHRPSMNQMDFRLLDYPSVIFRS